MQSSTLHRYIVVVWGKTVLEDQTPHPIIHTDAPTPITMRLSPESFPKWQPMKRPSCIPIPQCPSTPQQPSTPQCSRTPHHPYIPKPLTSINHPHHWVAWSHIPHPLNTPSNPTSWPPTPSTMSHSPTKTPSLQTDATINQFLPHLATINDQHLQHTASHFNANNTYTTSLCDVDKTHTTKHFDADSTHTISHCDADTVFSNSEIIPSSPTSSEYSARSSCDSNASAITTTNHRQLWPRVPINYNEAVLIKLHSRPTSKTFQQCLNTSPGYRWKGTNCSTVSTDFSDNELD